MRATEFIRDLLDLIDNLDGKEDGQLDFENESDDCGCGDGCDCPNCQNNLANSPDTVVTSVDYLIKDIAGGVNGPKHPADLKTATFPLYPGLQFKE
jgi:hypothetical protein